MFASFDSANTPGVKVWDFTSASAGSLQSRVALEDDCASFQYFITGGTTNAVNVWLPINSPAGKQVTLKNDRTGGNACVINIYDSVTGFGIATYTLGQGQALTFVAVPNATSRSATNASYPPCQWIPIQRGPHSSINTASGVLCGNNNSTTESFAVVAGGSGNTASGQFSAVGGGGSNTASGSYSVVAGGQSNSASSSNAAIVGGVSNSASNSQTFIGGGNSNAANASVSSVIGGYGGTTRSIVGVVATPGSSAPITATAGVSQAELLVIGRQTVNATATVLASSSSAAGSTNQLTLPNNSAYHVRGSVIANVTGGGDTKAWEFTAAIKRGAAAANTSLVGTPSVTSPYADAGASGWTVALSADTTNGALAVTVTGQAATTIRWVCKLESTEVTY